MQEKKKGIISTNNGNLKILGIKNYKQNDRVEITEIGEQSFVEIVKEDTRPVRLMRHLVNLI
jgi:hypothetical protein